MTGTIHIRCGSDIEETLALAGFDGDFLEWADPVCQGPVPGARADDRYFEDRAGFISSAWGYDFAETLGKLKDQTERLDQLEQYDRILLWFEHDLYDQAVLLRLCAELAVRPRLHSRLFIHSINHFSGIDRFIGFGQLRPDQLATLKGREVPASEAMIDGGCRGWTAYCAKDPMGLLRVMREGLPGFPYLFGALRRFFQEYPWTGDGLSLTERLCLVSAANGAGRPGHIFRDVYINREPQPFMGDVMFRAILSGLAVAPVPAITPFDDWPDEVSLTEFGESLVAGEADWIAENGIDRWLGGVHLVGDQAQWRWDEEEQGLVAAC